MKKLMMLISIFSLIAALVTLSSCVDEEITAKESLVGYWKVTSIRSMYGHFTARGHNLDSVKSQEGDLGYFDFESNGTVTYKFLRHDTTYQNTTSWILETRKEQSGFFKVFKYELAILNEYQFEVTFGNSAKNSQVNAREMEFVQWPDKVGYGVGIVMELKKQ